jgi:DNA-binding HxlR family transcriptional regulator
VGVRTYQQYCPIARASELLAERWTIIIVRNILVGCQTFNEIADGAPGLSLGLLSKRLRELERAGIIEIHPKPAGLGSTYEPTEAGRELSELMLTLERWGRKWAELRPEHAHPGVVLRVWANFFLDRGRLPRRRVVVRFEYPTLSGSARRSWLLIERGDAEYCLKHPGGDEELIVVVNDHLAFARWHMGQIQCRDALRCGAIEVEGSPPGTATAGRPPTHAPATTDRPGTSPPRRSQPLPPEPPRGRVRHAPLRFKRCSSPRLPFVPLAIELEALVHGAAPPAGLCTSGRWANRRTTRDGRLAWAQANTAQSSPSAGARGVRVQVPPRHRTLVR